MGLSPDDSIRNHITIAPLPWGGNGPVISPDGIAQTASDTGLPGCDIEVLALELGIFPLRYIRNMDTVSIPDQIRLLRSRVAMVGLGGLGGTLFEHFLRIGIGHIKVADGDTFETTNLNRQALATTDTLGSPKVDLALGAATRINPSVDIETRKEFLTETTLPSFLEGCDLVIDALGGLSHRLALQQAASDAEIPLVTGAIAGWSGYVATVMPRHTGPAHIMGTHDGVEERLGCPAPAVGLVASLMAGEAVRLLSGSIPPTTGRMLVIDLERLTFDSIVL
jgi:molybdopterin/thiamine biosynthesis adenylyltransferase